MKYLITNHWSGNLGDIAILEVTIAHILAVDPAAHITIESSDPKLTKSYFPAYDVVERPFPLKYVRHQPKYRSLKFLAGNPRFLAFIGIRSLALQLFKHTMANPLRIGVFEAYRQADVVIAAGGDYISKEYAYFLRFWEISLARHLGKRIVLYAHSIGPFKGTQIARARKYLSMADLILARDDRTRELLEDYQVKTTIVKTADTVISMEARQTGRADALIKQYAIGRKTVGLAIREINYSGLSRESHRSYLKAMQRLAGHLEKQGYDILLIAPSDADEAAARDFNRRRGLDYPVLATKLAMPSEIKYVFSKLRLVVSARMHPIMIASTAGTPVIALGKEFKMKGYMELIGMATYCLPVETLTADALLTLSDDALKDDAKLRRRLARGVRRVTRLSLKNTEALRALLQDRLPPAAKAASTEAGRAVVIDEQLTQNYLSRPVDSRMVSAIDTHLAGYGSVIDVACGSGLYGERLKRVCKRVYGIDYDAVLCDNAAQTGYYDKVICDKVEHMARRIKKVDAVFCSEFIEHVANQDLTDVMAVIESVAREKIVITVPNPRSPHFKHDPTHILKYDVNGLLRTLNESPDYSYRLYAMGFSDYNRRKPWYKILNIVAVSSAVLSPTVLYVGTAKK